MSFNKENNKFFVSYAASKLNTVIVSTVILAVLIFVALINLNLFVAIIISIIIGKTEFCKSRDSVSQELWVAE